MMTDYIFFTRPFPSGRVGRAGRSGAAYSMICQDEMPFVYDLHLFIGRPVQFATPDHSQGGLCRIHPLERFEAAIGLVTRLFLLC